MYQKISRSFSNNIEKLYYILGEGLSKGGALLFFPIFTNNLSKADFGQLSLYWSCIPFVSVFIDFCQRNYVKKIYIENIYELKNSILTVSFFSFASFIVFIVLHISLSFFDIYLISKEFDLLLIITAFLFTLIEIRLAILQMEGAAKQYSIIYTVKILTPYALTVLIFIFFNTFFLYAFPIVQILILVLLTGFFMFRDFSLRYIISVKDKIFGLLNKSFKFGAPLIFGTLSATGLNVSDRIIIGFSEGNEDIANYTVAYTISSIFTAFFMATNKWWQRFMLVKLKENKLLEINRTFWKYLTVVLSLLIVVLLIKDYLILFFAGEEYIEVVQIIPTLLIGMFFYFLYTILLNIPFYYGNSFYIVFPALIAFIINIALNLILIPSEGYEIAALTTTISYFIEFLIIYIICRKVYHINIFWGNK